MFEEFLLAQFQNHHYLDELALYHLTTGGKHLRGKLVLAEADAIGVSEDKALKWATACELLHNATLIHDDIQDNDPLRRGKISLWKRYGIPQAINTGDYLIFKSFQLAAEINVPALNKVLAQASIQLVKGQSDELEALPHHPDSYWEAYLKMARQKTGALFLLPIQGTHLINNHIINPIHREAWLELGVCYQIMDDIRDCLGLKQEGQKQKDFYEKRINAIVAYMAQFDEHKALIEAYLQENHGAETRQNLVNSLCQTAEESNVLVELEQIANQKLEYFKQYSNRRPRQLILTFMERALEKKETEHVPVTV